MCVCVCVCEREREREKEGGRERCMQRRGGLTLREMVEECAAHKGGVATYALMTEAVRSAAHSKEVRGRIGEREGGKEVQ